MAVLKNIKQFDNKCEWAYLYAIADVYQTYSGPHYGKTIDIFPHPLKDYEILRILEKDYGIKSLHPNTIANYRKKLEFYFGFVFKNNKKGRYVEKDSFEADNERLLLQTAFIVKETALKLLSSNRKQEILCFLASLSTSNKALIEGFSGFKKVDSDDQFYKFDLISKAIINGNNIIIFNNNQKKKLKVKPIKLYVDKEQIYLKYEHKGTVFWPEKYVTTCSLKNIVEITIVNRGRPSYSQSSANQK